MAFSQHKRIVGANCTIPSVKNTFMDFASFMVVGDSTSPSVKNTFVDIASFLFDKDFVTDPRKCKSLPNLHIESNLSYLGGAEKIHGIVEPRNLDGRSGSKIRDLSCRTADPMEDDISCDTRLSMADPWGMPVIPQQTLEQFLEPGIPAIPFAGPYPINPTITYAGPQELSSRQGRWRAYTDWTDTYDKNDCPLLAAANSISTRVTERFPAKRTSGGGRAFTGPKTANHSWTCRMLRNIPNDYSRSDLLAMLDAEYVQYDFAYLPLDWGKRANLGYAFVNLTSSAEAERVGRIFNGFCDWTVASEKVCEVAWAKGEQQGLQLIVESFKNNPVMHPDVPESFKPLLLDADKNRMPFPAPTKALRPPRGFLRERMQSN